MLPACTNAPARRTRTTRLCGSLRSCFSRSLTAFLGFIWEPAPPPARRKSTATGQLAQIEPFRPRLLRRERLLVVERHPARHGGEGPALGDRRHAAVEALVDARAEGRSRHLPRGLVLHLD